MDCVVKTEGRKEVDDDDDEDKTSENADSSQIHLSLKKTPSIHKHIKRIFDRYL